MKPYWQGVFPAVTTQLKKDQSLDLDATARHVEALIESGVTGLIMLGSLGENQALEPEEKRRVVEATVNVTDGRVPVLSGVAETSTAAACRYVNDCEELGAAGFMLMPAMVYKGDPRETMAHFRTVAKATGLPIMIYNNPISYGNDITPEMFAELADVKNFVALKESSGNPRRITDLHNTVGDRYAIFTGVDDLALESLWLGAAGWVAGLVCAFPRETVALFRLAQQGDVNKAVALYRWFMPLLHLDVSNKFVQNIKLVEALVGVGSETVRAPRLSLVGEEREVVIRTVEQALRTRPAL